MFEQRTVLVLGAGASVPFGFPSGVELARELVRLSPAAAAYRHMVEIAGQEATVSDFIRCLKYSAHRSIDAFLEDRPEFLDVGKAAIATLLLPRERVDALFPERDTWYEYLIARLPKNLPDLDGRLSIVTFNYDRSLEWFLFTAMANRFDLNMAGGHAHLMNIPVIHVYGSLGPLPLEPAPNPQVVDFGAPLDETVVRRAIGAIRIMYERGDSNPALEKARPLLLAAERLIFLGFAYDNVNVRRLLSYGPTPKQQFIGSAYGMTSAEATSAQRLLQSLGATNVSTFDNTGDAETLSFLRKYCFFG
jgi:hypothetical protein